MKLNVAKEVAALERMSPGRLREKYAEVFGERTNTGNKIWLVRRIIWRMQAKVEGGLSERARLRAEGCPDHASVEPRTRYPERDSVLAPAERGRNPIILRDMLPLAAIGDWCKQLQFWSRLSEGMERMR
jgi:hypothetical protein